MSRAQIETVKKKALRFGRGFRVAFGDAAAQAAEMVIPPGGSEGDDENRHRGADQWLFVVAGRGVVTIEGRRHALKAGMLVLIEKREKHRVRCLGDKPLRTLNFYVPPAYFPSGEPRKPGRR